MVVRPVKAKLGQKTIGDETMGIDMRHEDENGEMLEELLDPQALVSRILPPANGSDSVCLRFIDPYGDTVFNQLQIPILISELEHAQKSGVAPDVSQHLQSMLTLARRADGNTHTYIKFYGD